MTTEIALSCQAGAGVSEADANKICAELTVAFGDAYPLARLTEGSGIPRLNVIVTVSKSTAVGLQAVAVAASGTETVGQPMRMVIYDRTLTPERRRRFYDNFLLQNPVPL